jgi:hypothetical protein
VSSSQNKNRILGYGVCGPNERYLRATLDEFKRLCDHTVILLNNTDSDTVKLIESYGFDTVRDDREWGTSQHLIKQNFVEGLAKYDPEWLICLDMDETLEGLTREKFEESAQQCDAMYVFIVNLWNDGWKRGWSFWNIRAWKWNGMTRFVNRPLHCGLAPEWAYHYGSNVPIVLYHYGLKDEDTRARKVERYKKYDPDAKYRSKAYYDALLDNTSEPIDIEYIKHAVEKECLPIKRKKIVMNEKKHVYVIRQDGKIIDIPEYSLQEHLKRGFRLHTEPSVAPHKPVSEQIIGNTTEVSTPIKKKRETAKKV